MLSFVHYRILIFVIYTEGLRSDEQRWGLADTENSKGGSEFAIARATPRTS